MIAHLYKAEMLKRRFRRACCVSKCMRQAKSKLKALLGALQRMLMHRHYL